MDVTLKIVLIVVAVAILPDTKAENQDKISGVDSLINRLEHLESREKVRESENQDLKKRVQALEFLAKEQKIEISSLIETVDKQKNVNQGLQDRVLYLENRDKAKDVIKTDLTTQEKRSKSIERFIRRLTKKLPAKGSYHEDHKGTEVQRIQRRENEMNVAFYAYLTTHLENPGVHQIIAFDHVVTNIGNAYNAHAGDFRAPVAGTYFFATTLTAGSAALVYHFKFMHNGHSVSNIYLDHGGTSTQEVVLQLNQGDDVSIHTLDAGKKVYGSGYSTFSGFLLQQDYSSPAAVGK